MSQYGIACFCMPLLCLSTPPRMNGDGAYRFASTIRIFDFSSDKSWFNSDPPQYLTNRDTRPNYIDFCDPRLWSYWDSPTDRARFKAQYLDDCITNVSSELTSAAGTYSSKCQNISPLSPRSCYRQTKLTSFALFCRTSLYIAGYSNNPLTRNFIFYRRLLRRLPNARLHERAQSTQFGTKSHP